MHAYSIYFIHPLVLVFCLAHCEVSFINKIMEGLLIAREKPTLNKQVDFTHIADSLDPESLELLYESSFGARISVCQLSGSCHFPSQDSEFCSFWTRDVLFGFLG